MEKHLHIISFNVPLPADYGGVIDVFYKLKALYSAGIKIHLHCFSYGREKQYALEQYCETVYYYTRQTGFKGVGKKLPYIVSSRSNDELLNNLLKDDHPILMEGIHCTYLLNDDRFADRQCFVRLHNVEFMYYRDLYHNSNSLFKKVYYFFESRLLRSYEKLIAGKAIFFGVTEKDHFIYQNELHAKHVEHIPLFIPEWKADHLTNMGTGCLYHGDLSIEANEKAATWLIRKVFSKSNKSLVIAGKNPSVALQQLSAAHENIKLVPDPSGDELNELIRSAHIHVIPSYTNTGMKLKLLHVLFSGRHCIVNGETIAGTGLEAACHISKTADGFREMIDQLYHQTFTVADMEIRKQLLNKFDNKSNVGKIISLIWK